MDDLELIVGTASNIQQPRIVRPIPFRTALKDAKGLLNEHEISELARVLTNNYPGAESQDQLSASIEKALEYAMDRHYAVSKKRKGTDDPYIVHPVSTAYYLRATDPDDIVVQLLHDVPEETLKRYIERERKARRPGDVLDKLFAEYEAIRQKFGTGVAEQVWMLTNKHEIVAELLYARIEQLARYPEIGRPISIQLRRRIRSTDSVQDLALATLDEMEKLIAKKPDSTYTPNLTPVITNLKDIITANKDALTLADVIADNGYSEWKEEMDYTHYRIYLENLVRHPRSAEVRLIEKKLADTLNNLKTIQVGDESARRILRKAEMLIDITASHCSPESTSLNLSRLFYNVLDEALKQYEKETDRLGGGHETLGSPRTERWYDRAKVFYPKRKSFADTFYIGYVKQLMKRGTPAQITQEFRDQIVAYAENHGDFHDFYAYMQVLRSQNLLAAYANEYPIDGEGRPEIKDALGWPELFAWHNEMQKSVLDHYRARRRLQKKEGDTQNANILNQRIDDLERCRFGARPPKFRKHNVKFKPLEKTPYHII